MPAAMGVRPGDAPPQGGRFGGETGWTVRDGEFDLTRGATGVSLKLLFSDDKQAGTPGTSSAILDPKATALVIVDMQNCFLHPDRFPGISGGRQIVPSLQETVLQCRENGIKIIWLNWGLRDLDLRTMPPAFFYLFSNGNPDKSFGSDMGGHFGRKLMIDSWNARTYDELFEMQEAGLKAGTDVLIHKNRLSGLWDENTELSQYLKDQKISTLLFSGVNTDQCVYATLVDALHRGYDTLLVKDLCATPTPEYTTSMVTYSSALWGWVVSSAQLKNTFDARHTTRPAIKESR